MGCAGCTEQGGVAVGNAGEMRFGLGDRSLLHVIRPGKPPVKVKSVTGGIEDCAAVDQRASRIEGEPHPLDEGGKAPGVDCPAVDRGLAAHRLKLGPIGPGRRKRVTRECRIEADHRSGGLFERGTERRRSRGARG